jgi:hypothetical protein
MKAVEQGPDGHLASGHYRRIREQIKGLAIHGRQHPVGPRRVRKYEVEDVRRINFVYTPKHGSGLTVAECELSCLTSQCLSDRRIGDVEILQSEIATWAARTNVKQRAVDWQFTIEKARIELKRLYPKY